MSWLTNYPKIRIRETQKGHLVEVRNKTWYGKVYWSHIIGYSGMEEKPFYFSSFDSAMDNLKTCLEFEVLYETFQR